MKHVYVSEEDLESGEGLLYLQSVNKEKKRVNVNSDNPSAGLALFSV